MPRNPENRRVEILLSPEQYQALREYVQAEQFGDMDAEPQNKDMAEVIREILAWSIPSFGNAKPLRGRGKYKRSST